MFVPAPLFADNTRQEALTILQSRIMTPPPYTRALVCGITVGALVSWLAMAVGTRGGVMADPNLRQVSETTEGCPRCDMIFTLLETVPSGERMQHVEMVERGEGVCFAARIIPFDLNRACIPHWAFVHKRSQYVASKIGVCSHSNLDSCVITIFDVQCTCANICNSGSAPTCWY